MFTKNFKYLMVLNLLNATSNYTDFEIDTTVDPTYYDIKGTELNMNNGVWNCGAFVSALSDTLKTSSGTQNSSWLIIGTGTGTVSESDYCLFNQDSTCTCVSASSSTTSNLTKEYTATFQNNSESNVTITETGIVAYVYIYNNMFTVLLDHTLLDTPVTIPAGETRTITYVWSF